VAAFDLLILDDPEGALPPYDGFLAVSAEAAAHPGFMAVVSNLERKISDAAMRQANRLVDVDGRPVSEAVAYLQTFLD